MRFREASGDRLLSTSHPTFSCSEQRFFRSLKKRVLKISHPHASQDRRERHPPGKRFRDRFSEDCREAFGWSARIFSKTQPTARGHDIVLPTLRPPEVHPSIPPYIVRCSQQGLRSSGYAVVIISA